MEDRISELPKSVISSILSRLSAKDLVKTSLLSSKWRHNCSSMYQNFTFDVPNLFNYETPRFRLEVENYSLFKEFRQQFMERVDKFLHNFKGTKIISLKVLFFIESQVSSCADSWIAKASELGVEEIQLLFSHKPFFHNPEICFIPFQKYYRFPYQLLISSQSTAQAELSLLRLEKCILTPPLDFKGFSKLKTLQLEHVILGNDFVDTLCSNSPILQQLKLRFCLFPPMSDLANRVLKVDIPSIHTLNVLNCKYLYKVEISAANLTDLEFHGYVSQLVLTAAPCLANMYLCCDDDIPNLCSQLENLPRLEMLEVKLCLQKISKMPRDTSAFKNLKQLKLFYSRYEEGEDLMCVLDFLNACPVLEKLICTLVSSYGAKEGEQKIKEGPRYKYENLKQVEIVAFSGFWFEIELIVCILKNAIGLEQLVIDPNRRFYMGGGEWMCSEALSFWFQSGRDNLLKSLDAATIPPPLQLVIL